MKPCLALHGLQNLVDFYMTIEVIDDFITDNEYKDIYNHLHSPQFPWYYNPGKVNQDDGLMQLTHCFYRDVGAHSNWLKLLSPLYIKLNIIAPIKIKANTTFGRTEKVQTKFHIDGDQDLTHRKTAIFYLSDTNGPTLFKDPEQEVECKQNRIVKFDAHHEHAGVLHADDPSSRRIVINFNYY